jgi:hypothetical protein
MEKKWRRKVQNKAAKPLFKLMATKSELFIRHGKGVLIRLSATKSELSVWHSGLAGSSEAGS